MLGHKEGRRANALVAALAVYTFSSITAPAFADQLMLSRGTYMYVVDYINTDISNLSKLEWPKKFSKVYLPPGEKMIQIDDSDFGPDDSKRAEFWSSLVVLTQKGLFGIIEDYRTKVFDEDWIRKFNVNTSVRKDLFGELWHFIDDGCSTNHKYPSLAFILENTEAENQLNRGQVIQLRRGEAFKVVERFPDALWLEDFDPNYEECDSLSSSPSFRVKVPESAVKIVRIDEDFGGGWAEVEDTRQLRAAFFERSYFLVPVSYEGYCTTVDVRKEESRVYELQSEWAATVKAALSAVSLDGSFKRSTKTVSSNKVVQSVKRGYEGADFTAVQYYRPLDNSQIVLETWTYPCAAAQGVQTEAGVRENLVLRRVGGSYININCDLSKKLGLQIHKERNKVVLSTTDEYQKLFEHIAERFGYEDEESILSKVTVWAEGAVEDLKACSGARTAEPS
ncbi:MAG: hypothetical protein QNJ30_22880 [Kiloniellales bacterium]|nr:hypothetical protein [Kiloniellales bacterium]